MFDLGELLKYPFEDEKWAEKLLIGSALCIIPIINFLAVGYAIESMRAGIRGEMTLPEWGNWADKFVQGLMWFIINLIYVLITVPLMLLGAWGIAGALKYDDAGWGVAGGLLIFLAVVAGLVLGFILPMAIARYAAEDRLGAALEFSEIWRRIRTMFGQYLVAVVLFWAFSCIVVPLIAAIPLMGWIIAIVGVFYLMVVFANLFGRLYRQVDTGQV